MSSATSGARGVSTAMVVSGMAMNPIALPRSPRRHRRRIALHRQPGEKGEPGQGHEDGEGVEGRPAEGGGQVAGGAAGEPAAEAGGARKQGELGGREGLIAE